MAWDIKAFECNDLFRYNLVNFDSKTETYGISFYMNYLARWPEYFMKAENRQGQVIGYGETHLQEILSFLCQPTIINACEFLAKQALS